MTPYGLSPGNPGAVSPYSRAEIIAAAQAQNAALFGSPGSPLVSPSPQAENAMASPGAPASGNLVTIALIGLVLYFVLGHK